VITIRAIEPDDRAAMRRLLAAAELPTDDLDDPSIALFGAFTDQLLGVIGLQTCGTEALLRSLAVEPAHRDLGIARRLCEHVFAQRAQLWLLTTTAKDYFARYGFEVVAREEVPAQIRATAQFSSLCPSSAHVMRRQSTATSSMM